MFDGKTKKIVINSLEEKVYRNDDGSKVTMIKFKDQYGDKYKFYSHLKSDPTKMSAAFTAFEEGKFKDGTEIEVGYKEVPKEKVIEGKNCKWTDRFVSFFNEVDMKQIPSAKKVEEEEIDLSSIPF